MAGNDSNRAHNEAVLRQLSPGDRIEFPREIILGKLYSHWAIYIGDEEVIHLAGDENAGLKGILAPGSLFSCSGVMTSKAQVKSDNFWTVARQSKARLNNEKDREMSPLPPSEIVSRAKKRVSEKKYSLLFANCEHFVNCCRYKEATSDQVFTAVETGATLLALGTPRNIAAFAVVKVFQSFMQKDEQEK